jgi:hypothetical protein
MQDGLFAHSTSRMAAGSEHRRVFRREMNDQLYSSSDVNRDLDAQALAHHLLIESIIAQGHTPRRKKLARI